ncbi:MAG: STAS domain-containing protein, partial [Quisquiliibacterium sp.]
AINLDTTGLDCLEEVLRLVRERGGRLLIVAANEQPLSLMRRSGFAQNLGEENLFADLGSALASIEQNRPIA